MYQTKYKEPMKWGENMKGRFVSGILTGSIVGATVGMYAVTRMSPRQRRRMMKASRKVMSNIVGNIGLF